MSEFFKSTAPTKPKDSLVKQGDWNANTNTPTLADGTGTKGHYYKVSDAGTQDLGSGSIDFTVGDLVVYDGSVWEKYDTEDLVTSVFSRTGDVTAQASDYDASQIDNDSGVTGAFVSDALDQLETDKADKVSGATAGNVAELDASGNLVDGGKVVDDLATKNDSIVNALIFG